MSPDTVNRWLDISGGVARETQMLPAWSYPTNLETQGEPEAANKVGEEREASTQDTDLEAALGFGLELRSVRSWAGSVQAAGVGTEWQAPGGDNNPPQKRHGYASLVYG